MAGRRSKPVEGKQSPAGRKTKTARKKSKRRAEGKQKGHFDRTSIDFNRLTQAETAAPP
jgi:hypothetical protein